MKAITSSFIITLWALLSATAPARAADEAVLEALSDYLEFSDYRGGVIQPEQIAAEDWPSFFVIDTRDAAQFAQEHIPGAVNIEWRQILARRNEIPKDKPVLLYCNTGSLSAQAAMALRLAGFEQVKVLQEGFLGWKAKRSP